MSDESPTAETKPLGATALLARGLTPGKLRGLQRICNANGTLSILAIDHPASMMHGTSYGEIVHSKLDLCRQIGPATSGVLIDAYYGAWPAIASGAIPRDRGLLVRLEMSEPTTNQAGGLLSKIEPGWSAEKAKLMGADAVKLLAPYAPHEPESAEYQLVFVQQVYEECKKLDLLLMLEPITYPLAGESKTDRRFLARKADTVIESARQLSRYCDVFKVEFPGTLDVESDDQLADNLQALSESSERPWVLLSAGVEYPQYLEQLQMAVEVGCSGFVGGRAFWKEYFEQLDPAARTQFAATTARARVAEADALVRENASPWFDRYGLSLEDMAGVQVGEGWHARYARHARSAPGYNTGLGDVS